jgi:hypothetical protein
MPEIYELFGYPLADQYEEAEANRRAAKCPFMGTSCNGGGNRMMTEVNLANHPELKLYFGNRNSVAAGVCSIQLDPKEKPWIVCPKRLFSLGGVGVAGANQGTVHDLVLRHSGHPKGTRLGVWTEVKMKFSDYRAETEMQVSFDYTFDYVLMALMHTSSEEVEKLTGETWKAASKRLEKAEYSIVEEGGHSIVRDFPSGSPLLIEVMTSSTSSNDKKKRSTIPNAFEDAIRHSKKAALGARN